MTRNITLAAILAAAFAAPAAAMTSGLSPLEADAASVLAKYEFAVDVSDLRLGQVAEIVNIGDAAVQGQNSTVTRNQIEVALARR